MFCLMALNGPIQRSCDYELQEEQFSGKKNTGSKITS